MYSFMSKVSILTFIYVSYLTLIIVQMSAIAQLLKHLTAGSKIKGLTPAIAQNHKKTGDKHPKTILILVSVSVLTQNIT